MRFDYQSPIIQTRLFRIRRHLSPIFAGIGVSFIIFGLFYKAPSLSDSEVNIQETEYVVTQQISSRLKSIIKPQETPAYDEENWKTITVKSGDSLSKIFHEVSLPSTTLYNLMSANPASKQLESLQPGQVLCLLLDDDHELKEIKLQLSPSKLLHIRHTENGYKYYYEEKQLSKQYGFCSNTISDSLFASAQASGLSSRLIMQLADIFGWDIDFALDIRPDDSFRVLFEEIYLEGEKIDTGNIIAAEFVNQGKVFKAVRFTDEAGHIGYYSPEGYSMQKAFLRTPVKFTKIGSHFSTARRHPILHKIRAHKGVDYVAPHGTPIKAAGYGKIIYKGTRGGYGKTIEIAHGRKYSTLYAHLSQYGPQIKQGTNVKQGQIIGFVGRTGLATGDHLHYEFRVNGIHRDPLTVKLPKSAPINKNYEKSFISHSDQMLNLLNVHSVAKLAKK